MSVTQRYKISYKTAVAARTAIYHHIVQIQDTLMRSDLDPFMRDYWSARLVEMRAAMAELEAV